MLKSLTLAFFVAISFFAAAQRWQNLGPCGSDTYGNHVASQGGTGQIHSIVFDPDSQNIVYACAPFGGLWKSVDSGKSWSNANIDVDQSLEFSSVSDIAITKNAGVKTLWIATGHPSARGDALRIFEPFSSGIYTSVNGGRNFKPLTSFNKKHGFNFNNKKRISRIIAHPSHPEIMYVATSDGLYQTTDAGLNWKLVLVGKDVSESGIEKGKTRRAEIELNPAVRINEEDETGDDEHSGAGIFSVAFSKTDEHVVYASGTDIYRSDKSGKKGSFKSITHNLEDLFGNTKDCLRALNMNLELNTANGKDVMYVAAFIKGDTCGAYKKQNAYGIFYFDGTTWVKQNNPGFSMPDAIRLKMASVPGHPNVIYAGSATVSLSEDFGKTWKEVIDYSQPGHADIHALTIIPGTNDVMAGTDGGIFRYTYNTKKVDEYNNGLCLGQVIDMGTSATNPNRIIIGMQDQGADLWDGTAWTKLPASGDGYYGQLIDYSNDMNFFSCHNFTFFQSGSDSRITLKGCNVCSKGCPYSFAQDPKRPNIFYFGEKDIYKSVDSAKTWCRVSDFSHKGIYLNPSGQILYDIEIAPSDPDIIFASFIAYHNSCNTALFKSVTGGSDCNGNCGNPVGPDDWQLINIPKVEGNDNSYHFISSIAISDKSADKYWLGFSYSNLDDASFRMFKTEDNGLTWQNDDKGLPDYPVNKVLYVKGSDDELFAGTWNGVYHKKGNSTWQKFGEGLPHVYVSDMEINYPSHKLRVSTFGRGVWEIGLP